MHDTYKSVYSFTVHSFLRISTTVAWASGNAEKLFTDLFVLEGRLLVGEGRGVTSSEFSVC
jgi:hypothetical protein